MKVLSIGNSFSEDAQRYLHRLAKHNGVNLRTVNLLIGGCSLQTHYWNMLDDRADYSYVFNGEYTGLKVSIRQALRATRGITSPCSRSAHIARKARVISPLSRSLPHT